MGRITSIDVTYSSNGSPHSATISTIEGEILHPDKSVIVSPLGNIKTLGVGESIGSVAGTLATNLVANNFVVDEITTSTDPYKTTKTYRLIDKVSQILDGYAILVRGQNVSPFGGINYKGRAYDAGEVPDTAWNATAARGAIPPEIYEDDKIIVLGRTRSVFTPSVPYGNSIDPVQNRIHAVYEAGSLVNNVSLNADGVTVDMIKQQIDSVSLLYGYTLSDVKLALEDAKIGLKLVGFPTAENALFNTSGSIRSVLSSIASTFGLYWFVAQNNEVRFLNAKDIGGENTKVDTFYNALTSNNLVIEKSISDRGYGPTIISSFRGTTEPLKPSQVVYRLPGASVSKRKMFKVRIKDILTYSGSKISRIHLKKLFALFSWFNATEEEFDKFFWALNITDSTFAIGDIYPSTFQDKTVTETNKINLFPDIRDASNDTKKYYELRLTPTSSGKAKSPSELGIYQFCQAFFNSFGRIYISASFNDQSETFSSSSVNIAANTDVGSNGSFKGSTKLVEIQDEIPEIASFLQMASIAEFNINNATVFDLYKQTSSYSVGDTVNTVNGYYFIGTRSAFNIPVPNASFDSASIKKRVNDNISTIDRGYINYIGILNDDAKSLSTASIALFDELISENDISAKFVYATVSAVQEDGTNQNNEIPDQPQAATDSNPDMKYNETYYKALSQNGGNNIELRHFEGSIKDAEIFAEFYPKSTEPTLQKSASAKYYGLVIPDFDITLDSVNISVGSEGVETTVTRSTKNLIPIDQGVVLANNQASNNRDFNRTLTSSQKRIFNR
jgi:hypothetical protein